jgi:Cu-Zn family superoxide dismutase
MIYSNNGYSFMLYYTNRFKPDDVVGKSVIIHSMFDDMTTQPAGNSGNRIACGTITKRRWMFA